MATTTPSDMSLTFERLALPYQAHRQLIHTSGVTAVGRDREWPQ